MPEGAMGPASRGRSFSLLMAAWVLSLGFDFFLHGGLLAELYTRESPFLLPPERAFARIPAGYATFFLLTGGLFWLFRRLDVRTGRAGARVGALTGLFLWGVMALALWSVTTAPLDLLAGWGVGQGVELGLAGLVLGAGRGGAPLRRIWIRVALAVVGFLVITVVLQSVGWAPQQTR